MARLAVAATLALTMISAQPMDNDLVPDASQTSSVESPSSERSSDDFDVTPEPEVVDDERVMAPPDGRLERLASCIIWRESRGNPNAVNPRSGASGLGQFLPSTWRTTPYAGYSVFNAWANRQAVIWMLSVGRGKEFVTINGC
jgi:hypothetical protein